MESPKTAIVTGGADGFGAAIVDRFSQEGWKVIILDLNKSAGEAKARDDPNLQFVFGDVSKQETWETVLDTIRKDYGRVDVIVNNAGITHDPSPLHTKSIEEYERTFNVNVKVTHPNLHVKTKYLLDATQPIFLSASTFAPFMLKQGHGVFINITSTGFTRPRPGFAIYNASKAAVTGFTRTLALEYAPVIRFNCIAPAVGNTSMLRNSIGTGAGSDQKLQTVMDSIPMKRVTEPQDVANAAWYLGSDQSSFVTGTTLEVDGGRGV
ncbi:uncharacterized protein N7496_009289 [Penicillium cataractarum]|uniref:Uncharacterized protein n=1 Tax=Penicillium cataractarum TaxID=2100454 RepID=A0A9W9RP61_9EURO|nr:uncharacterized protein N7496_009289 [Penicillium cataractarum]KAJ5363576.1 hypothetical protein N7496_009289 [Penicillium cataractarum]